MVCVFIIGCAGWNFKEQPKQIEPSNNLLVVTVLKSLQTDENKESETTNEGTGGLVDNTVLTNVEKTDVETIIYPAWKIDPPLHCLRITQNYRSSHRAIDFSSTDGTCKSYDIMAVDDGVVVYASWMQGYGYRIEIQHENSYISTYSHLSKLNVKVGMEVLSGTVIGIMGSTGNSTGIHLHFEIINNKIKLDPNSYL